VAPTLTISTTTVSTSSLGPTSPPQPIGAVTSKRERETTTKEDRDTSKKRHRGSDRTGDSTTLTIKRSSPIRPSTTDTTNEDKFQSEKLKELRERIREEKERNERNEKEKSESTGKEIPNEKNREERRHVPEKRPEDKIREAEETAKTRRLKRFPTPNPDQISNTKSRSSHKSTQEYLIMICNLVQE